jgi:hypothetical protein
MRHAFQAPTLALALLLASCMSTADTPTPPAADRPEPPALLLADFNGQDHRTDTRSGEWRTVNDNIMGGRSSGGGQIRDGVMIFRGSTNTNGGGFSSIRTNQKQWDLSPYQGLAARVRADGRRYVFHLSTGLRANGSEVFYRGSFDTRPLLDPNNPDQPDTTAPDDLWQTVFVPFSDFVPMIRGRDVSARVQPLDPAAVRGIGLMIDDGLDGPFVLHADWIKATTPTP